MQVRAIDLRRFTAHKQRYIELPDTGITVLTGGNGSGKSSVIEAVSWAIWGKTLRGTLPTGEVPADVVLQVTAGGEDYRIHRHRHKSKQELAWSTDPDGDHPVKWETPTKATKALLASLGLYHGVWARTAVFTTEGAARFTAASDADRKRLLESLLGLGAFDAALTECRRRAKITRRQLADATSTAAFARGEAAAQQRVVEDAQALTEHQAELPDAGALTERLGGVQALVESYDALQAEARATKNTAMRAESDAHAAHTTAKRRIASLDVDKCPVCERSMDDAQVTRLRAAANDAALLASTALAEASASLQVVADEVGELAGELEDLRAQERALQRELDQAQHLATQRRRLDEDLASAEGRLTELAAKVAELAGQQQVHEVAVAVHSVAEQVLGLRGVRVQLLADALSGITAVANGYLDRLAPGVALKVAPHKVLKDGTVADTIDLQIEGVGGGHGYAGASGGERRRIDVAILLALAETSAERGGTLFLDEVFDALDAPGIAAVSELLGELAAERSILVITHSRDLAAALPATARITL